MAATPQPSTVTYEELADLEAEFDDLDVELLRLQARRERPLYERRAQLVRCIPNFWPLVLEQAPPEIDQYIQPTDANLLLSALEDVEITRFEVLEADEASTIAADTATEAPAMAGSANGTTTVLPDPRSLAIRFTFAPNDYFADRVLEKRFWYRHAPSGGRDGGGSSSWSGLVSEPVTVQWKPGKDLTGGVLDLAVQAFQAAGTDREADATAALQAALDKTSVDGLSFFAWFGYVGRRITAQESQTAAAEQRAKRAAREARRAEKRNQGASAAEGEEDEAEDDEDDDDDGGYPHEIFLDGDTVAVTLAEDVWPNAIKYFRQAQEQDALSDDDFESGSEVDEPSGAPPSKKQKT